MFVKLATKRRQEYEVNLDKFVPGRKTAVIMQGEN